MVERVVWLEVALNGPWGREVQPKIPVGVREIVAEGIACAKEGAAIVHVHAYDEATGRQRDDAETYRRIIEGIREQEDVIVYPTLPVMGGPDAPRAMTAPERFKAVEQLAMQGLLEWTVVDPGSVNFAHYDRLVAIQEGFVYLNAARDWDGFREACATAWSSRRATASIRATRSTSRASCASAPRSPASTPMRPSRSTGSCSRTGSHSASRPRSTRSRLT